VFSVPSVVKGFQSAQRGGHSTTIFPDLSNGISCKPETISRFGFPFTSAIMASEAQRYSSSRVFLIQTKRMSKGLITPELS
jgi:hypothetical protein